MKTFIYLSKWITQWSQKPHNFTECDYQIPNHPQNVIITDFLITKSLGHKQVQNISFRLCMVTLMSCGLSDRPYQFRKLLLFFYILDISL